MMKLNSPKEKKPTQEIANPNHKATLNKRLKKKSLRSFHRAFHGLRLIATESKPVIAKDDD